MKLFLLGYCVVLLIVGYLAVAAVIREHKSHKEAMRTLEGEELAKYLDSYLRMYPTDKPIFGSWWKFWEMGGRRPAHRRGGPFS